MMTAPAFSERWISLRRGALTLIIAAAIYDALARSGYFSQALTPTLPTIAHTLVASLAHGTMILHAAATLYRVLIGFGFAVAIGLPLGVLMGRFRPVENFVLPLMSALMPIPSLAWVPVFILWFGLGNTVSVLIVFYAALFPMLLNTWSGVRAVNPARRAPWARTNTRCSGRSSFPAPRPSSLRACANPSCAPGSR